MARQIREARKKQKIKQLDVLNKTRIHVGRIEMGDQAITVYTLYRLCEYLQVNPEGLIAQARSACESSKETCNS